MNSQALIERLSYVFQQQPSAMDNVQVKIIELWQQLGSLNIPKLIKGNYLKVGKHAEV